MRTRARRLAFLPALLLMAGCASSPDWRSVLAAQLPLLGHRNFIAVVDSAYPLQANGAIRTVLADGAHEDVVAEVLRAVDAAPHVRAVVWLDREFEHVSDRHAPGATALRQRLTDRIGDREVRRALHERIIQRLDETAATFDVLVLKTGEATPYSSVFVELQCGYWSDEAERALRTRIE